MWLRAFVIVGSLVLAAGCGDDSSDETRTDRSSESTTSTTEPDGSGPSSTDLPGGALPDRPADLVGEVTESEGERFLVEEQPGSPDAGRKAWVAIEGPVFRAAAGGDPQPAAPSDVGVGQQVSAWTEICAESYPEQCGAQALVIE